MVQPVLTNPEKANRQIRLLWLGCGRDDNLFAAKWTETPGYAHRWTLWRLYLRDFAQMAFPAI
jgi:hypothetical protein